MIDTLIHLCSGAHVTGLCAKKIDSQLDHIVGLDPALPLFSLEDRTNRIDAGDA